MIQTSVGLDGSLNDEAVLAPLVIVNELDIDFGLLEKNLLPIKLVLLLTNVSRALVLAARVLDSRSVHWATSSAHS